MSRLFIQLYLDEDVDVTIAAMLRSRGFHVVTTVETGRRGTTDEGQLTYAAEHGLAILTHNRVDFEVLARDWLSAGRVHHGIIIAVRRPSPEIVKRLLIILNQVTADEMDNQVRYV